MTRKILAITFSALFLVIIAVGCTKEKPIEETTTQETTTQEITTQEITTQEITTQETTTQKATTTQKVTTTQKTTPTRPLTFYEIALVDKFVEQKDKSVSYSKKALDEFAVNDIAFLHSIIMSSQEMEKATPYIRDNAFLTSIVGENKLSKLDEECANVTEKANQWQKMFNAGSLPTSDDVFNTYFVLMNASSDIMDAIIEYINQYTT